MLKEVSAVQFEWLGVKPNHHRRETIRRERRRVRRDKQVAAAQVNFVFQLKNDRLLRNRDVQLSLVSHDSLHSGLLIRGKGEDGVTWSNCSAGDAARKTSEICVRANHALDWKAKFARVTI